MRTVAAPLVELVWKKLPYVRLRGRTIFPEQIIYRTMRGTEASFQEIGFALKPK